MLISRERGGGVQFSYGTRCVKRSSRYDQAEGGRGGREGGGKEGGGGECVKQTSRDYQVRFSDGFDIAT